MANVEATIKTINNPMQIHDAVEYTTEYPIERMYRDIRRFR